MLAKKLNTILDVIAPVKKIQLHHSFTPSLSEKCKAKMAARDAANKKATKSNLDTDWAAFRQVINSVTRRLDGCRQAGWTPSRRERWLGLG